MDERRDEHLLTDAEILGLEDRFWKAIQERDGAAAAAMTAPGCLIVDGTSMCVLHTESIAGDPFGRDRKPASGG